MHRAQQRQGDVHLAEGGDDYRADDQRDRRAPDVADVQHGHGPGQLLAREAVGQQGIGRRSVGRLAGAEPGPGDEHRPEAAGEAAGGGGEAPERDPRGDHQPAALAVGNARQREAQHQVDAAEGEADQDPHLGVRQLQVLFDRLQQQGKDVAVDLGEPQHQGQHPQGAPGCGRAGPGRRGGGRGRRRGLVGGRLERHARLPPGLSPGDLKPPRQN